MISWLITTGVADCPTSPVECCRSCDQFGCQFMDYLSIRILSSSISGCYLWPTVSLVRGGGESYSFVTYRLLTEPSVRDFLSRMHLCQQAEADVWVELQMCRYAQQIQSVLQSVLDTQSGSQKVWRVPASDWRATGKQATAGGVVDAPHPRSRRNAKWGHEYGSTAWLISWGSIQQSFIPVHYPSPSSCLSHTPTEFQPFQEIKLREL